MAVSTRERALRHTPSPTPGKFSRVFSDPYPCISRSASKPGVTGVAAADANGLCVGVRGILRPEVAGHAAAVVASAAKLGGDSGEVPVVSIHQHHRTTVLSQARGVTTAVLYQEE